jgi:hypothetical protein
LSHRSEKDKVTAIGVQIVRSGRPLLHVMISWAVAGPHFIEEITTFSDQTIKILSSLLFHMYSRRASCTRLKFYF